MSNGTFSAVAAFIGVISINIGNMPLTSLRCIVIIRLTVRKQQQISRVR